MVEDLPSALQDVAEAVNSVVGEALRARGEERIALAGTANLSRHSVDFARTISPVLEALEEQVVLLKLLTTMHGYGGFHRAGEQA